MKKLIIVLSAIIALLPAAAFADHYDGVYQGFGSNYISFGIGTRSMRFGHGGNVAFVDHRGRHFDQRQLRRGHPIRVEYTGRRGHETVRRVIVQQRNRGRDRNHGRNGDHGR